MSELEACPFCGGEAEVTDLGESVNVSCGVLDDDSDTCGAVLFGGNKSNIVKMVNKWNTRTPPKDKDNE